MPYKSKSQTKKSSSASYISAPLNVLMKVKETLNHLFVGREKEVNDIMTTLVSGDNLLLVAPAGTGKTSMVKILGKLVNATVFYKTATPYDLREDYFGYIDIQELIASKRIRFIGLSITNAEIIFIDEIFRSSSAVRNLLLEILAKRTVDNKPTRCLAFFSASNFISLEEEDLAFVDRFLKNFHGYISDQYIKDLLEKSIDISILEYFDRLAKVFGEQNSSDLANGKIKISPVMNIKDIITLQKFVLLESKKIIHNQEFLKILSKARERLREEGIILSDRALAKIPIITVAYTIVSGERFSPSKVLRILPMFGRSEEEAKTIEQIALDLKKQFLGSEIEKLEGIKTQLAQLMALVSNAEQRILKKELDVSEFEEIKRKVKEFANRSLKILRSLKHIQDLQNDIDSTINDIKYIIAKVDSLAQYLRGFS